MMSLRTFVEALGVFDFLGFGLGPVISCVVPDHAGIDEVLLPMAALMTVGGLLQLLLGPVADRVNRRGMAVTGLSRDRWWLHNIGADDQFRDHSGLVRPRGRSPGGGRTRGRRGGAGGCRPAAWNGDDDESGLYGVRGPARSGGRSAAA